MELVEGVVDMGAQEINVTGVAAVEPIGSDQVRVTYYVHRKGGKSVAVHLIWGRRAWIGCWAMWSSVRDLLMFETADFVEVATDIGDSKMH